MTIVKRLHGSHALVLCSSYHTLSRIECLLYGREDFMPELEIIKTKHIIVISIINTRKMEKF